jgi:hypothetical protein
MCLAVPRNERRDATGHPDPEHGSAMALSRIIGSIATSIRVNADAAALKGYPHKRRSSSASARPPGPGRTGPPSPPFVLSAGDRADRRGRRAMGPAHRPTTGWSCWWARLDFLHYIDFVINVAFG